MNGNLILMNYATLDLNLIYTSLGWKVGFKLAIIYWWKLKDSQIQAKKKFK